MEENGTVIKVSKNIAIVKVGSNHECSKCGLCSGEKKSPEIEAIDNIGVSIGDEVTIKIQPSKVLKFSASIYIFPLLAAVIGYLMFYFIFKKNEGLGIIGSFTFLIISFLIASKINKKSDRMVHCEIISRKLKQ